MTPELDWLKRWAHYSPLKVAIQCGESGRTFTYSDLFKQSQQLAGTLAERFGIERGDRVACLAQNEL
jgi:fatty-acyl-CoA synthase